MAPKDLKFRSKYNSLYANFTPTLAYLWYLVLIPAYLYKPLYHLLHRVRIERRTLGSHLSWVTLLRLPSVIVLPVTLLCLSCVIVLRVTLLQQDCFFPRFLPHVTLIGGVPISDCCSSEEISLDNYKHTDADIDNIAANNVLR